MRIIFLNCWNGRLEKELLNFIKKQSETTDAFCFQEVPSDLQLKITNILVGYNNFYKNIRVKNEFVDSYGQCVFIKKHLLIKKFESIEVFKNRKPNYGFLQVATINLSGTEISIANFHGRPQPGHKMDTVTRIKQSMSIVNFFKSKTGLEIIGGDFNLEPNTRSLKILETAGYVNLIKEHEIKATRNEIAWRESVVDDRKGIFKYYTKQYFADYCFVSPELNVKSFKVPNVEVSDHLPLILEFEA